MHLTLIAEGKVRALDSKREPREVKSIQSYIFVSSFTLFYKVCDFLK
jgi:hypothetical protein